MTADELFWMPDDGLLHELVRGELMVKPFGSMIHGVMNMALSCRLAQYVEENDLGVTLSAGCGYVIERNPDTVLDPDGGFISRARAVFPELDSYIEGPPDLVLEVIEPDEARATVMQRVLDWLAAGARVAWVLWCGSRTIQVWRAPYDVVTLGPDDTLTCEDLLPGFALELSKVLS